MLHRPFFFCLLGRHGLAATTFDAPSHARELVDAAIIDRLDTFTDGCADSALSRPVDGELGCVRSS